MIHYIWTFPFLSRFLSYWNTYIWSCPLPSPCPSSFVLLPIILIVMHCIIQDCCYSCFPFASPSYPLLLSCRVMLLLARVEPLLALAVTILLLPPFLVFTADCLPLLSSSETVSFLQMMLLWVDSWYTNSLEDKFENSGLEEGGSEGIPWPIPPVVDITLPLPILSVLDVVVHVSSPDATSLLTSPRFTVVSSTLSSSPSTLSSLPHH